MTIETTFTCDRCKVSVESINDLWTLGLSIKQSASPHTPVNRQAAHTTLMRNIVQSEYRRDLCSTCAQLTGMVGPEEDRPKPKPTMDSLMDEILGQHVDDWMSDHQGEY